MSGDGFPSSKERSLYGLTCQAVKLFDRAMFAVRNRLGAFNGRLRDECLNEHWFVTLAQARAVIEPHQFLALRFRQPFRASEVFGMTQRLQSSLLAQPLPAHHRLARYAHPACDLRLGMPCSQQPRSVPSAPLQLLAFL